MITVTVNKGLQSFHYFNSPVIPRVGETFGIYSTRNESGDYVYDIPEERFVGIVKDVVYEISQRGESSRTYDITLYINIYLEV